MLIQFNHANKAGYFTASYPKEINSSVKIETSEEKDETYGLYSNNKEIMKIKSKDNIIPIDFRYTEEGSYTYDLKLSKEEIELEDKYKNIIKELEIDVYYDPVINKLRYNSNADDLIFRDNYLYDKDELKKADETLIVEVPDTKSNDYSYLVGLLIILLSGFYVKRRLN